MALTFGLTMCATPALADSAIVGDRLSTAAPQQQTLIQQQAATVGMQYAQALSAATTILVDGVPVNDPNLTTINGTTYVTLTTLLNALRPDASVTWDGAQIVVYAHDLYMTARPNAKYIEANGRALYVPELVQQVPGDIMLPVRVLAEVLGATAIWDDATQMVQVTSGSGAIVSADQYYNADDLYWLSRVISSESGNQSLEGKIAVGTVVINRVEDSRFADTIEGVIFSPGQFSPVAYGTIYRTPTEESVLAAKLCLDGAREAEDSLYFLNPSISTSNWAQRTRPFVETIGDHWFYG